MQAVTAVRIQSFVKSNFNIQNMIKITLSNSQVVYLAPKAILEIYPMTGTDQSVIRTANNEYIVNSSKVPHIVEETEDKTVSHLTSAVRDLTTLLRARLR